jgi:uncharacterized membrane protein YagU involved in acid resistance
MAVAGVGLLLQWAMSLLIAAVYVVVADIVSVLKRRWAIGGLAYSVVVFFVMNYVVVPLSAWHRQAHFTALRLGENLAAMLLFGLIIAYCTRTAIIRVRHSSPT